MQLSSVYRPIRQDLEQVEKILQETTRADLSWLPAPLANDLRSNGKVTELLDHILRNSGKRIRPALVILSGKFHSYNPEQLLVAAAATEIMHTATLIHDDAIDNSPLRRGQPTINSIWDNEKAILLGDYLFARAGELTTGTKNLEVLTIFWQTLMTITSGELAQSFTSFNPALSRDQYWHRITGKTAALFSLATESGAILSQSPESYTRTLKKYGHNIGIAFQVVDDIMDYSGTKTEIGKPSGSDLLQGTLTLPTIMLMERQPTNNTVKELFQNSEIVIEMVRKSTILEECHAIAADYCARACRSLNLLPDNTIRKSLMNLADYILERRK